MQFMDEFSSCARQLDTALNEGKNKEGLEC